MIRRPPRSTRTDTLFPTRRSSDLLAAARKAKIGDSFGQGRKRGSCKARTAEQQAQFVAEQTLEVKRIIKKMAAAGDLPDDPRAEEALDRKSTRLNSSH